MTAPLLQALDSMRATGSLDPAVRRADPALDIMLDIVPIGAVLLGKYRVDGVIGEGGMGIVLLAFHLQLRERVALKFPKRECLRWPGASARFLSEARAAIRIKSEHVARVVDVGTLDDGTPFIVMEYLEGETLCQYASRQSPLDVETIIEFITQISEAIAEAHALGIVHRDLKPANIFLTRRADGILAAKVLDFGISQVTDAAWDDIASKVDVESALGSPAYASPEQLQSPDQVDARSDVWSLGVIMYELATGRLPFDAETTVALCGRVIFDPFMPLHSVRPDLPLELCDVVDRCLEKRAENRHASVGHLAAALLPFASQRARASIERIVRTIDMGSEMGATLVPFVRQTDLVLSRGKKAATGLLPAGHLRSAVLAVAAVGVLAMTLHAQSSPVPDRTIPSGASRDAVLPSPAVRSGGVAALSGSRVPALHDTAPRGAAGALVAQSTSSVIASPKRDAVPAKRRSVAAKLELPRATPRSAAVAASDVELQRPPPTPTPIAPPAVKAPAPSHNEHDLDDPAYSNRK